MTTIEKQILLFVQARAAMFGRMPTRSDILKHMGSADAYHAVHALWQSKMIESVPLRRAKSPIRFQLTASGVQALQVAA